MQTKRFAIVAAASCLMSASAWAANPWSTAWQLDKVKSAPPGASFVITKTDDGSYLYKSPSQTYKFRCDGADYTIRGTMSMSCKESAEQMDVFYKTEGSQTSRIHRTLSKDGKVMTTETVLHSMPNKAPNNPDLHAMSDSELKRQTYDRMGDGQGFAGTWKEKVENDGTGPVLETTLKSSTFEMNYTDRHQDTTLPLNGKEVTVKGSITLSVEPGDAHTMKLTMKNNGAVFLQGTLVMSDDTKTLTEDWWKPEHPEQKQHKVYNRM